MKQADLGVGLVGAQVRDSFRMSRFDRGVNELANSSELQTLHNIQVAAAFDLSQAIKQAFNREYPSSQLSLGVVELYFGAGFLNQPDTNKRSTASEGPILTVWGQGALVGRIFEIESGPRETPSASGLLFSELPIPAFGSVFLYRLAALIGWEQGQYKLCPLSAFLLTVVPGGLEDRLLRGSTGFAAVLKAYGCSEDADAAAAFFNSNAALLQWQSSLKRAQLGDRDLGLVNLYMQRIWHLVDARIPGFRLHSCFGI